MKIIRWILCFMGAGFVSFLGLLFSECVFSKSYSGGGILQSVVGLAPLVLSAAIPTISYAIAGMLIIRPKTRLPVFVIFGMSLLFTTAHLRVPLYEKIGVLQFWLSYEIGILLGALLGLSLNLMMYRVWHKPKPNQPLQTTPTAVTPAAGAPGAPSAVVVHH